MDAKTLEALKASIAKWERNAEAKTPGEFRTNAYDCPLCELFKVLPHECEGCPVFDRTRVRGCRETPYISAATAKHDWWLNDVQGADDRARAAARDEVAFLKSLLPEETP